MNIVFLAIIKKMGLKTFNQCFVVILFEKFIYIFIY